MRIAIIYSIPTRRAFTTAYLASDEDTQESAEKVYQALLEKEQEPFLVPISEDTIADIANVSADCIINLIEWSGLDLPLNFAAVEALTETGIPFTGADLENLKKTSDKISMKKALEEAHLPTARWQEFTTGQENVREDFVYPVIVKLALEHCSIGLSQDAVVLDEESLKKLVGDRLKTFLQPVIAEEFITGREFQVTVLNRAQPLGLSVLPPAEIFFTQSQGFLTFNGRWDSEHPDYKTSSIGVAQLSPELASALTSVALDGFRLLNFSDYARFDVRVRDEKISILEANSNPGLDDDPEYSITVSYKAIGMTFADFLWEIIASCLRRFRAPK